MRPVKCPGLVVLPTVLYYSQVSQHQRRSSKPSPAFKGTFCTDPCDFITEALFNSMNLMLGSAGMMWAVSASNSSFFSPVFSVGGKGTLFSRGENNVSGRSMIDHRSCGSKRGAGIKAFPGQEGLIRGENGSI